MVNFIMSATTVGVHPITAIQDAKVASAQFTLCTTQPIDERTGEALTGIETEVGNIEGKLDDPNTGLAEIKSEVAAMQW
jgi:NifB/MoaA-like Fe-S oxidoreductase